MFLFLMKSCALCIYFSLGWKFFAEKEKVVYEEIRVSACTTTTCLGSGFPKAHWVI